MSRLAWIALAFWGASALAAADNRVIGTIEATVDGEPMSWKVIYSESDDSGSAMWRASGDGRTAMITGFESADVTFVKDERGVQTPVGGGSVISITFRFEPDAENADYTLPAAGAGSASVLFMPIAGDYAAMYGLSEGRLIADTIEISGGGRFAGTFTGVLQNRSDGRLHITDGRFDVTEATEFKPGAVHSDR